MDPERRKLRDLIDKRCLTIGPTFTLSTGEASNFYFNCKPVTLCGDSLSLVTDAFMEEINELPIEPTAIGGLTMGADFIVAAVVTRAHETRHATATGSIVRKERKEHGTQNVIENVQQAGTKIVIVDDVITTGKSTEIAGDAFRDAGYDIVGIMALVDREAGGLVSLRERYNCPVVALLAKRDFSRLLDDTGSSEADCQVAVSA